jgi:exonuclease SbcD
MRFLHTADWHLGRLLHKHHLTKDQAHVLDQFVEAAHTYAPDAVIVAGDIYDRAVPPSDAVEVLDRTLSRLVVDAELPVILIAGNHDSPDRLDFGSSILERQGLHVLCNPRTDPIVLEDTDGPIYVAGLPYAQPAQARQVFDTDDPIRSHEAVVSAQLDHVRSQIPAEARSIAVAHIFAQRGTVGDSERTLVGGAETVPTTLFEGFDYVALGHLHQRQEAGAPHIRYAGSPMKYSFSEHNHTKSFYVVDMDADGTCTVEAVPFEPPHDLRCIEGAFHDVINRGATDPNANDYLQITLTNRGPVTDAMTRLREVYPNCLHVAFPHVKLDADDDLMPPADTDTPADVFRTFYRYATGTALAQDDEPLLETALERVESNRRNA